ncbi:YqiA/YcfP family alpha/beta fold hydrolase [Porphyromonas cangingivalis]|uniref:YqiA/YcfP family alpha/beta fold hydrolase n=1 Tax=Porphyromonas cangingivalis TaxID=36874 RepID=UPI0011DE32EE|nr:YqiA/YcfP family alpha/beta fold hydrolase [Porphyromonas cangingivalis]
MKKILYIHGYNSSSESRTAQVLLAHLGEGFELIHPTFSNDPEEAIPMARRIIREEGVDMVVATSLGGFVALSLRGIPKFVINPSVAPHLTLPNNGYDGDLSGFERLSKVIWMISMRQNARIRPVFLVSMMNSFRTETSSPHTMRMS